MEYKKYIAIDPGVTTGYAIAIHQDKKLYIYPKEAEHEHLELYGLLFELRPDHVVYETFEYRREQRDNLVLYSCELIGILHLCHQQRIFPCLWKQMAAEGKGYFTDDTLKRKGVYIRGMEHSRDAIRHLLHWFTFKGGSQFNNDPEMEIVTKEFMEERFFPQEQE